MTPERSSWHTHTSVEGQFAVSFPGQPETFDQTHIHEDENPPRTAVVHAIFFGPYTLNHFEVVWQVPNLEPDDPREGAAAIKQLNEDFAFEYELTGKEIHIDGVLGLEATWRTLTGFAKRKRLFLLDNIVISQSYEGPESDQNSPDVETFFSSLRFPSKAGRKIS
jgi:hypothetical protein